MIGHLVCSWVGYSDDYYLFFIIRALALHKTCGHQDHHYNHHQTHTNYATQRSPVKVHWKLHIGIYMIHTNPRMKEKQCPKGPSIASLQVASPYIHLSGWRKSWKEDQWTMRFWEERSINHIGLVQWSQILNQRLQESFKQVFKQDEQETVRLNVVLNRRLVNHEVFEWEIGKPHRVVQWSHIANQMFKKLLEQFFKQNNRRI